MESSDSTRAVIVGSEPWSRSLDQFRERVAAHGVSHVLLPPSVDGLRLRAVLDLCGGLRLQFKAITSPSNDSALADLRNMEADDLVRRDPSVSIDDGIRGRIAGRHALVTGAAGTIGAETCKQLLEAGANRLIMVDLDARRLEDVHDRLAARFSGAVVVAEPADIRDSARVLSLVERHRPQDIVHAAAQKHLPDLETAPREAAWTNVLGTRNLVEAADRCGAERFVYVSTDKAVRPSSVMGASKRVGEEIVRDANLRSRTRFAAVRFGNVIGSSRSVVPLFRKQIASGGPIRVTHPEVSRYFMTRAEAVSLVLGAACSESGDLFMLDMGEPIRIVDLARYLVSLAGLAPDRDVPIAFTGLRPGEKLHEDLLGPCEHARPDRPGVSSVSGTRPAAGLEPSLRDLEEAVRTRDDARALDLLRHLAPGYACRGGVDDPRVPP